MGNSRVLQKATKELTKAKAPAKSRDIIYDPAGQLKFPGLETKVPTPDGSITMNGVPFTVYGVDNTGFAQMMYPDNDYQFRGDVVHEYPQMKKGGRPRGLIPMPKPSKKGLASKAYSRSLDATNKLFTENALFKKSKDKRRKVFDPNAKYYADGGEHGCPKGYVKDENGACVKAQAHKEVVVKAKKIDPVIKKLNRLREKLEYYDSQNDGLGPASMSDMTKRADIFKDIAELEAKHKNKLRNTPRLDQANVIGNTMLTVGKYFMPKQFETGANYLLNAIDAYDYIQNPNNQNNQRGIASDMLSPLKSKRSRLAPFSTASDVINLKQQLDKFQNAKNQEYQDGGEYGMPLGTGVSQNFIGNRDEFKVGGIPELPLRDNQVNYDAYVNRFEPKTRQYEDGGYIEAELAPEDIDKFVKGGYVIEDISIPSLNQYDKGGRFKRRKKKQEEQEQLKYRPPVEVNDEMYESVTPFPEAPEEFKQGVGNIKEVEKKAQAPDWLKFSNEYEKKNSKQAFIDEKKKEYLKGTNQGLLKAQGYNMENFPEDVERNFEKAYDYKKNSFIVKKLGKKEKFSPNRRGEWVDKLSKKEKEIVANSKYESKLQPSYWSRTLAGLQELYGDVYAPGVSSRIPIPGLTKKEQKDIQNSKLGAFETLAGWDALGAVAANALEKSGNSGYGASYRESPGILSGEKMAGVTDAHAMALNPLNYTLPYDMAAAAPSIIKGAGNVANVTKTVGKNLIQASPLKKAYKYNPWAFKADKEAAYRMLGGKEGYLDAVESGLLRPNQKTGRYDATFYNVGEPLDRYKAGYDTQYMAEVPLSNEKIYPRFSGDDYRISEELGTEAFDTRVPKGHVGIYEPGVNLYKEHWLQGYKKVKPPKATKKLEVVPSEEELIDLWRIQEKGDRPMAELAAEGKLGPMFKNEKAIQHFKDREKYFGQWFTKDKADLDWYKTDREFKDPEIINLKIPKSKLEEFQNYDKTLSRASDREFVIPQEEQGLYKVSETPKELPGSSNKSFMGKVKDYFDRPPGPLMLGMSKGAVFTKEIKNPDYFLDLMKINKYSPKNKKYFEDLIATVKRQGNVASERQYDELQRLKTGDMNYGKKGFAKGGIVSELSKKQIKDLVAQGYIVEDVD